MGNNGEGKSSKSEKSSLPPSQDQTSVHIHPDWAAMQAYYGPQMAMAPYYNSGIAPGHAPPYMWGPAQPMMPPYGAPYATLYPHGGVYTHPGVPLGSPPPGHGIPSSPMATTPSSVETPNKSSGNNDQSLTKTVKGFNGLSMSTGKNVAVRAKHRPSQSVGTEGSSDGSDGNTTETDETRKKRSREGTPTTGGEGKTKAKSNSVPQGEDLVSEKALSLTVPPMKPLAFAPGLELENPPSMNARSNPSEAWFQDERELKREKRKQSNRESARRSRLRKQAETEELARKVEALQAENVALKDELNQLAEKAEKLKVENAALGVGRSACSWPLILFLFPSFFRWWEEKLKGTESGQTSETILSSPSSMGAPITTENLLSSANDSASADRNIEEGEMFNKNRKSGVKLHQLMDTSSRADAVAAS